MQRKSEFDLPPSLGTTLELGHFDHLEERLTRSMYKQRLHVLLHIEEFERRRQMTRLKNCLYINHAFRIPNNNLDFVNIDQMLILSEK